MAFSTGVSYPAINPSTLGNLPIPVPPLSTQSGISDFLARETARIDQLIEKKERLVVVLGEQLSRQIDQAVTSGLDRLAPLRSVPLQWLPSVPHHWNIERAKYLFREAQRSPREDDRIITAFRDGQVTLRENRRIEGFTTAILEVGYQHVNAGDLVIHSMDAFAGAIGVSDSDGKATGEYAVCEARSDLVNSEYYAHLLRCIAKRDYIYVICPSVRERAPRFRYARFAQLPLPVPPRADQDEIVEYIRAVSLFNQSVRLKTTISVDRLRELRSSLITAATTGQIDVATWSRRGETDRRLEAIEHDLEAEREEAAI